MKKYFHPKYKYVAIVEIPKNEIKKIDFAACIEPAETVGSYYNRQAEKPNVIINAGFFSMVHGTPCFNLLDEGDIRSYHEDYNVGMGTKKTNNANLVFGNVKEDTDSWDDFISGYPVLLDGNGPITYFGAYSELNYYATRSCLGFNNDTIFVVQIGKPGMLFADMSKMLYELGVTHAINLDGGGSARLMVQGEVFGYPTENRRVDNIFAIYLNNNTEIEQPIINNVVGDTPYISYTVQKGDTWWNIAKKFLSSPLQYKELMTFNNVSAAFLKVGNVIKIPAKSTKYIVHAGDSWWKIATTEMGSGIRYKELAEYNNKKITDVLHPGDVLNIPV